MNGNFHAGGWDEHWKQVGDPHKLRLSRLHRRFRLLAAKLCRRKGPLRGVRIMLGWMKIRRRLGRLKPAEDKSRALWLGT